MGRQFKFNVELILCDGANRETLAIKNRSVKVKELSILLL